MVKSCSVQLHPTRGVNHPFVQCLHLTTSNHVGMVSSHIVIRRRMAIVISWHNKVTQKPWLKQQKLSQFWNLEVQNQGVGKVAYMITIKEKPYFIHLKKQSFLSPVSVVYSYDKYDTQKTNNPFDQMDCNYYGYIAGIPNSLVSLSTCSGLRGILQLKNISYGIEPMEVASGFMHMIYEDKDYYTNISLLGISDIYNSNYQYRKSSEFDYMGSDIKAVTQKVIQIFGLVNTQVEGSSLESYAVSIVQLLSLHMGLSFDNTDTCYCSGDVCTMSPEAMHSRGVKDFSTCSLDEFKYFASNSSLECLHNSLPIKPVYKRKKYICGNGILEKGEQCDCGLAKECTHKKCCDPTSCRFKGRVVCGSGECCTQNCKLKPGGEICRKQYDEDCDFLEYCNGIDPHCVPDTFKRDGEYCNRNESFCYKGHCRMFDKQCRDLIGGAARGAQFACYDEINSRGDRYGNCGKGLCSFPHLMCGKLVCAWPHKAIVSKANLSVIYTQIRNEICVSTFLSSDRIPANDRTTVNTPEDRDKTFIEDGTSCGPDMICNNFQHCHCDKGFAPPYCKPQKNAFGSRDDGHLYVDVSIAQSCIGKDIAVTNICYSAANGFT
ncbi:PREDICTED: disintegrin and metalloproteinase domain-containing protein 5-like [Myotis davidii]|uniref:disintegrin and metalloproteinase domain-containing protein 5-like n=1 Tax=Myotis davidii TaxID=225400 RepID=UPI0003EC02BB|nr:PREDICTED: disintegrin and metalloproteinase domain-containing protein 5-like [Myotis davidii]